MPNSKIRLLLVDNQTIVREGIHLILSQQKDFLTVASVGSWQEAVAIAPSTNPHVIIVDSWKVRLDANAAITLLNAAPKAKLLLLSALAETRTVAELLGAGASGHVSKLSPSTDLIQAIRTVLAGETYLDPRMQERLANHRQRLREQALKKDLSDREEMVLRLIAKGHTNKSVASILSVSEKTVETYRRRAMQKIEAFSKPDLVRIASERGWLTS